MNESSSGMVRDPGDAAGGPDTREQHDGSDRSSGMPYVEPGRDEQGRVQPSVPHEGLLSRIALSVVLGQSVVLAVVAVWGFVVTAGDGYTADAPATVLALGMNGLHATILAAAAVLGAAAALSARRTLRAWAAVQFGVFLLLFAFGAAYSEVTVDRTGMNLNTPAHVLHGVLAILGFVVMMLSSARIVEPPPAPMPYPQDDGGSDDHAGSDERAASDGRRG